MTDDDLVALVLEDKSQKMNISSINYLMSNFKVVDINYRNGYRYREEITKKVFKKQELVAGSVEALYNTLEKWLDEV